MIDDRPEAARRLEAARIARGFRTAKDAATFFGWNYVSYSQHESGERGIVRQSGKYARAFGVGEGWLLTGDGEGPAIDAGTQPELRPSSPDTGPVVRAGAVAAGVFREVDDFDQSEPDKIWEPVDERFPNARRMFFDVEGDSMNDLKPRPILPGDRLICVSFEDVAEQVKVRDGLVVIVERTRDGGHTREWSVKQVELYEDRIEFCPRSTNPKHKPIVVKRDAMADEGVSVEIICLVRRATNEFPI